MKIRSIFFKEGKSNFFDQTWTEITEIIFSISGKKFKIFSFILFEKRRLAQGIRWLKVADFPLLNQRKADDLGDRLELDIYHTPIKNSQLKQYDGKFEENSEKYFRKY